MEAWFDIPGALEWFASTFGDVIHDFEKRSNMYMRAEREDRQRILCTNPVPTQSHRWKPISTGGKKPIQEGLTESSQRTHSRTGLKMNQVRIQIHRSPFVDSNFSGLNMHTENCHVDEFEFLELILTNKSAGIKPALSLW